MRPSLKIYSQELLKDLFSFKKTNRVWHIPLLAALCVGIPLFIALYLNRPGDGLIASMSGLVILYLPVQASPLKRIGKLLLCSVAILFCYGIGLAFSFHPLLSAVAFGLSATFIHWISLRSDLKAPGNFFFIMFGAIAACQDYSPSLMPHKLSLVAAGTLLACLLALLYSLLFSRNKLPVKQHTEKKLPEKAVSFLEAIILGLFMFASIYFAKALKLENPYWIPISCLAVMQGVTLYHIWSRVFQRILGTFVGLGLCWIILFSLKQTYAIFIAIVCLQFIVEILIVRHYALAVVFITPMTLLLAEAAQPLIQQPNHLFQIRFTHIAIGSIAGALGGLFIHHEKIRSHSIKHIRRAGGILKRK